MVTKVSDTVVDTMAEAQFKHLPGESSGLNFVIQGGTFVEVTDDGGPITFAKQTLALTDNAVNYIYFDFSNTPATLEVSTSKPTSGIMLIFQVITLSGVVNSYIDYRWKQINNRYLQDAFWPANESEIIFFKHQASSGRDGVYILRGLDTPFQRLSAVVEQKAGDLRLVADDSTIGQNGYGFWRSMSPDGLRMAQGRGVNSGSNPPFTAFERDSAGVPAIDWVALAGPPQLLNDSSVPQIPQVHNVEYNPVYNEVLVSASTLWCIYDDDGAGVYTQNLPMDSFDTAPQGSGQRTQRGHAWTADGETLALTYAGGSAFSFYDRSLSGARYQLVNRETLASNDYNSASVIWDAANEEFLFRGNTAAAEKLTGFAFNASSGDWEQQWEEDGTTNPTFIGPQQGSNMWVSPDGQYLFITGAAVTGAPGIVRLTRRVGGGWEYLDDWTPPGTIDPDFNYSDLTEFVPGYQYLSAFGSYSTHPSRDMILSYDGSGNFRVVMELDGNYQTSTVTDFPFGKTATGAGVQILKDGTLDDAFDSAVMPFAPYYSWSVTTTAAQDLFDLDKRVYGWTHPTQFIGTTSNLDNYPIQNDDTTVVGPTLITGPLSGTYGLEVVAGGQDLLSISGHFDSNDFLADGTNNIPRAGEEGTIVVIWKSPSSWAAVTDSANITRPVISIGALNAIPASQPVMALGVNIESSGAQAKWSLCMGADNSSQEALLLKSSVDVPTNQWNVTMLRQDWSEGGISVWNNGAEIELDPFNTSHRWPGGRYMWLNRITATKAIALMGSSDVTSFEIAGGAIHGFAMYRNPLRVVDYERICSSYGVI